ncbi:MAG: hypothetical protein ACK5LX_13455 [Oscillospiraceae bacterium]
MKKFMQLVAAVKTPASFAFTGGIMLLTVASMFLGKDAVSVGLIWQAIFLALIFGVLQFIAFSDRAFPRMGTPGRMFFLGVSMLAVLAVFALVFRWFPLGSVVNWLVFAGLYIAVFAIASIALRIVFRVGELKYNELLAAYKSRQGS